MFSSAYEQSASTQLVDSQSEPKSSTTAESDVIFANDFNSNQGKTRDPATEYYSSQPEMFYIHLAFDHLATNSLRAVEALPFIRFTKHDAFLYKWWFTAKKWNILCDEILALEEPSSRGLGSEEGGDGLGDEGLEPPELDVTASYHLFQIFRVFANSCSSHWLFQLSREGEFVTDDNAPSAGTSISSGSATKPYYSRTVANRRRAPLKALNKLCTEHRARVICIGDVHGCIDELCDLLREVKYKPGDTVLFLGDLVAKGPNSTEVIRLAMDIGALSVRGNHDHEVVKQGTC